MPGTRTGHIVPGLGARIVQRRKALGLSQARLAALAGISEPTVQNLERGRYGTTAAVAVQLALALGVTCDWLLVGEDGHRVGNPT